MAINPNHTITAIQNFMAIKSNSPSRTAPCTRIVFWDEDWNRGSETTLGTRVFVTKRLATLIFGYEIISGDCWFLNISKLFFFYVARILPRILHRILKLFAGSRGRILPRSYQDPGRNFYHRISTRVVKVHREYSPAACILHAKID